MKPLLASLFALILLAAHPAASATPDSTKAPCSSPEAAQFDFWVGDWQLTWADTLHGTNHVTKPLGSCVIQEQFSANGPQGFRGMSVSVYDPNAHQWQQTWVDNDGAYMLFTGGFADGKMILSRKITKNGKPLAQRMVFSDIESDKFNWDWQSSSDDGATWKTTWHIAYRRAGK
jgi:hypothetical protein